jgi:hypothetical protein
MWTAVVLVSVQFGPAAALAAFLSAISFSLAWGQTHIARHLESSLLELIGIV